MKKRIKWLAPAFQQKDGKASSRKITAFATGSMFFVSWVMNVFLQVTTDPILLYSLVIIGGLSFSLFTIQNIIDIMKTHPFGGFGNYGGYNGC